MEHPIPCILELDRLHAHDLYIPIVYDIVVNAFPPKNLGSVIVSLLNPISFKVMFDSRHQHVFLISIQTVGQAWPQS